MCNTSRRRSISLHPGKNGGRSKVAEDSKVWMSRLMDTSPRQKWPKSRSNIEDPVVPLERNVYGHPLAGLLRESQFQEVLVGVGWEKVPNWNWPFDNKDCSYRHTWMTWKWLEESRTWRPFGRNWGILWILENKHHFLTVFSWDAFDVNVNRTRIFLTNKKNDPTEKLPGWEKLHAETIAWSYDMEGHAKKVRWKALWTGTQKRLSNCGKTQSLAWTITTSRRRNWRRSENFPMNAFKLSWNACIWHEMVDLTFCGPWMNSLDPSPNGKELVTDG